MRERVRRAGLLDGCVTKGSWVSAPGFLLTASRDWHRFNYWLGGREGDRLRADVQLHEAMVRDAGAARWAVTRWWHRRVARSYMRAVRRYGAPLFHHAERERTWEDLWAELTRAEG